MHLNSKLLGRSLEHGCFNHGLRFEVLEALEDAVIVLLPNAWHQTAGVIVAHRVRLNPAIQRDVVVVGSEVLRDCEFQAAAVMHAEEELDDTLSERLLSHHVRSLVVLHKRLCHPGLKYQSC